MTPATVEIHAENSEEKSEKDVKEEWEAVPEQQLEGVTEERRPEVSTEDELLEHCANNQSHSSSHVATGAAHEESLAETKTEDSGSTDENATSEVDAVTATTVAIANTASSQVTFTTEEMAELAELWAVCPPASVGPGSSYHRWAAVRWANWSLIDRVFYLVSSRSQD